MHRYKILQTIDAHYYGNVFKAENTENGQMYILEEHKKKCNSWDECISIRQVKVLRVLNHPNIIKLKEIIRQDKELFLVFEYYDLNLQQWYNEIADARKTIGLNVIKKIIYQIALAINQCHNNGIIHRDLCPENIYINKGQFVKVGQFSNAEFLKKQNYTEYVTPRWYRSPEAILRLQQGLKIDIWSLGCIMAELFYMRPFFTGLSELDQLMRILKIVGIPNHKEYPEFHTLCQSKNIQIPHFDTIGLNQFFPNASSEAIDLMNQMLNVNPAKRISIQKVLQHPFFSDISKLPNQESFQPEEIKIKKQQEELKKQQEQLKKQFALNLDTLRRPSQKDVLESDQQLSSKSLDSRRRSSLSQRRTSQDSNVNQSQKQGRPSLFSQNNTPKNSDNKIGFSSFVNQSAASKKSDKIQITQIKSELFDKNINQKYEEEEDDYEATAEQQKQLLMNKSEQKSEEIELAK